MLGSNTASLEGAVRLGIVDVFTWEGGIVSYSSVSMGSQPNDSKWLSSRTENLFERSVVVLAKLTLRVCDCFGIDDDVDVDDGSVVALDVKSVTRTRRSRIGGVFLGGGFFMVIHTGAWSDASGIQP